MEDIIDYTIPVEGQLKIIKTVEEVIDIAMLQSQLISFISQRDEAQAKIDDAQVKINRYNEIINDQ